MPYVVEWDSDEHTVIRTVYGSPFSWADAFAAQKEVNKMIDTTKSEVSSILDLSQVSSLPPRAVPNIKDLISQAHPRTDYTILVGMNLFVRTLENTVGRVYRKVIGQKQDKSFFAKDMAEARDKIRQLRKRTPNA